jgi:hypothetical protein
MQMRNLVLVCILAVLLLVPTSEAIKNPSKAKRGRKGGGGGGGGGGDGGGGGGKRTDKHDERSATFSHKMDKLFLRAADSDDYNPDELTEMRAEINDHTQRRKVLNQRRKALQNNRNLDDDFRDVMKQIKALDEEHSQFFARHAERLPSKHQREDEREKNRERKIEDQQMKSARLVENLWSAAQEKKGDGSGDTFSDEDLDALRQELDEWLETEKSIWSVENRPNIPVGTKPKDRTDSQRAAVELHQQDLKAHKAKKDAIRRKVRSGGEF